jgi:tetratricopeptide (TPR) repeat protein
MEGEYFTWLSHDDLWLQDKIEKQIIFFEVNPDCKICYTDYYVIDSLGNAFQSVEVPWYPRQKAIRELFKYGYIHGCTIMVEKTCFGKVGLFSEQLKYTQDIEMWIRLSKEYELGRVPEKLIKGRRHSQQGSKNNSAHFSEKTSMLEVAFLSFGIDELFPECQTIKEIPKKKAKACNWFGDIMSHYRHQFDLAEKYYKQSIEIDPSWLNNARIHLLRNMIHKNFLNILKNKYIAPFRIFFRFFILHYQKLVKNNPRS